MKTLVRNPHDTRTSGGFRIFQHFCRKLHGNKRNWTESMGVPSTHLDPLLRTHWVTYLCFWNREPRQICLGPCSLRPRPAPRSRIAPDGRSRPNSSPSRSRTECRLPPTETQNNGIIDCLVHADGNICNCACFCFCLLRVGHTVRLLLRFDYRNKWVVLDSMEMFRLCDCKNDTKFYSVHYKNSQSQSYRVSRATTFYLFDLG